MQGFFCFLPEVRDGDDHQQVEHHSEHNKTVHPSFEKNALKAGR